MPSQKAASHCPAPHSKATLCAADTLLTSLEAGFQHIRRNGNSPVEDPCHASSEENAGHTEVTDTAETLNTKHVWFYVVEEQQHSLPELEKTS